MVQHLGGDDYVVRLRDGRSLGFAQYGRPDGAVVVNAHGGLVGRLDVDRFAAMGWSMGGQYAAALGHAMPSRVTRIGIIAGALPLTESGVFAELPVFDRAYTRLSQRAPWLARQCFRSMALLARSAPMLNGRLAALALGGADADVLKAEGYQTFSHVSYEGLRRASGVVDDYRTWMLPWGFTPEDLRVPVDVWSGVDDHLVPAGWGRELAQRIPGATHYVRAGGHFVAHQHFAELFEALQR